MEIMTRTPIPFPKRPTKNRNPTEHKPTPKKSTKFHHHCVCFKRNFSGRRQLYARLLMRGFLHMLMLEDQCQLQHRQLGAREDCDLLPYCAKSDSMQSLYVPSRSAVWSRHAKWRNVSSMPQKLAQSILGFYDGHCWSACVMMAARWSPKTFAS